MCKHAVMMRVCMAQTHFLSGGSEGCGLEGGRLVGKPEGWRGVSQGGGKVLRFGVLCSEAGVLREASERL